jgi:hypothetical protein
VKKVKYKEISNGIIINKLFLQGRRKEPNTHRKKKINMSYAYLFKYIIIGDTGK